MDKLDLRHVTSARQLRKIARDNGLIHKYSRFNQSDMINHFIISHESTPDHLHIIRYATYDNSECFKEKQIMEFDIEKSIEGEYLSEVTIDALQKAVNRELFNEEVCKIVSNILDYRITTRVTSTWREHYAAMKLVYRKDITKLLAKLNKQHQ